MCTRLRIRKQRSVFHPTRTRCRTVSVRLREKESLCRTSSRGGGRITLGRRDGFEPSTSSRWTVECCVPEMFRTYLKEHPNRPPTLPVVTDFGHERGGVQDTHLSVSHKTRSTHTSDPPRLRSVSEMRDPSVERWKLKRSSSELKLE